MHLVTPLSRKPLGRQGFVLVVARDLADPFAPGKMISDGENIYTIVSVEAADDPREVQLLVKTVA